MLKCSVCCGLLLLMQMCISVSCEVRHLLTVRPPPKLYLWFLSVLSMHVCVHIHMCLEEYTYGYINRN